MLQVATIPLRAPLPARSLGLALAAAIFLAGCLAPPSTGPTPPRPGTPAPTTLATDRPMSEPSQMRPVTVGLPFRPDVQFTPFYVAQQMGHFADQGLDVAFEYGDETAFMRLVAAGRMAATIASGEQVVLAAAQDVPIRYVATWYQKFPIAVAAVDHALASPRDLVGLTVGLPAPSGASYLGWQALLASQGIDPDSVATEVIGFTQTEALLGGRVDAAVVYAANEPLQLAAAERQPSVLLIADYFNFVANGLVVAADTVDADPDLAGGLVRGFLAGLAATLAEPDAAFEVALSVVPEAADPSVRQRQLQVLERSLDFWRAERLGAIDHAAWNSTVDFLVDQGFVASPPDLAVMIDERFLDQ